MYKILELKLGRLLFVLAFLVTGCQSVEPSFNIVFTADLNGNQDIYRMNLSSKNAERLTYTPNVTEQLLHVSRNGKEILFDILGNSGVLPRRVYILNTQDMITKSLTDDLDILSYPGSWSPNEEQIAFLTRDRQSSLMLMDANGTNYVEIPLSIRNAPTYQYPTPILDWTMDGKNIIFSAGNFFSEPPLKQHVYIVRLEDFQIRQITEASLGLCGNPIRSPEDNKILVTCKLDSALSSISSLYVIDLDDQFAAPIRIGPSDTSCFEPSWSPDGNQLAFVCDKVTDLMGLFITDSVGNGIHEMKLENFAILKEPVWSPDGKQIVYVAGVDSGHTNIYSISPDGSNNHPVTNQEAFYSIVAVYPLP